MMTLEQAYAVFERLMNEDRVYIDRTMKFEDLCGWMGVDAHMLDAMLQEELGYDGEGVLDAFRKGENERLEEKYGLGFFFET